GQGRPPVQGELILPLESIPQSQPSLHHPLSPISLSPISLSLTTHHSSLITHHSLLITHYSLLILCRCRRQRGSQRRSHQTRHAMPGRLLRRPCRQARLFGSMGSPPRSRHACAPSSIWSSGSQKDQALSR